MADDGFSGVDPADMTSEEKALADSIYAAMMKSQDDSARSEQGRQYIIGVSDIGWCSDRLRRTLDRQEPSDNPDMLKAFIGTWIGEGIEQAIQAAWPNAILQSEVSVTIRGDQGTYKLPGHPDVILPDEKILLDGKVSHGLDLPRKAWFNDFQKRVQRHSYAAAALEQGMFGDASPDEVRVGNFWTDRSADEPGIYLKLEPLDLTVLDEAAAWIDDVVYALRNGEEAQKEPARPICEKTCKFFTKCRAYDTDVSGLITEQELLDAVELKNEAAQLASKARRMEKAAKATLRGVTGTTGTHSVRWTDVAPVDIEAYTRKGYTRLDVSEIRKPT